MFPKWRDQRIVDPTDLDDILCFVFVVSDSIGQSEEIRRKKENQIIFQLVLIVGTFVFGYFPTSGMYAFAFFNGKMLLFKNV